MLNVKKLIIISKWVLENKENKVTPNWSSVQSKQRWSRCVGACLQSQLSTCEDVNLWAFRGSLVYIASSSDALRQLQWRASTQTCLCIQHCQTHTSTINVYNDFSLNNETARRLMNPNAFSVIALIHNRAFYPKREDGLAGKVVIFNPKFSPWPHVVEGKELTLTRCSLTTCPVTCTVHGHKNTNVKV